MRRSLLSSPLYDTVRRASTHEQNGQGLRGPVRLGRRTKDLAPTLQPGAIVVVHHADMDAVAANALLARRPQAVVNIARWVSGRYPNRGPRVLLAGGVALFEVASNDEPPPDLFSLFTNGETVTILGESLTKADVTVALVALTPETLQAQLAEARTHLDEELARFAANTLQFLERDDERGLLLDPVAVPQTPVRFADRAALVVVRGENYEEDLRRLGPYIREQKPVIIAVDGAADALLALNLRPDIILGDMDSVSDKALRSCPTLIVHAYARARTAPTVEIHAPGLARIEKLGLNAQTFPVGGTSEDAALLLAYEKGADLIVAVGTHSNLEDFLDKGRAGMASTFLVRLKVGSRLVDARGVSHLYGERQKVGPMLWFLLAAGAFPVLILFASTPPGQIALRALLVWFRLLFRFG